MSPALKKFVSGCRVLHIACSMLGLLAMALFAATGIMLVHAKEFDAGVSSRIEIKRSIPAEVAHSDDGARIAQAVCEAVREGGAVESVEGADKKFRVVLSKPGKRFDCEVDEAGNVVGTLEDFGIKGMLISLHRGWFAESGAWRILMDVGAACLLISCVTGVILCIAAPKWRMVGLAALAVGGLIYIGACVWMIL